jgi:hypothetical protein
VGDWQTTGPLKPWDGIGAGVHPSPLPVGSSVAIPVLVRTVVAQKLEDGHETEV